MVRACYHLLDLISFLTAGPKRSAPGPSDGAPRPPGLPERSTPISKRLYRAETVAFDVLKRLGSVAAPGKGLVRKERKEYVVQDGDVMLFLFNV